MRIPGPSLLLLLLSLAAPGFAAEDKVRAAEEEAGKWLALLDGRQYRESWTRAATLFRRQVNAEQWQQAMTAARSPLGDLRSRKLLSATYATSLPGAPDGEYVVLQYQASFSAKKSAIETVTPMLDGGNWRVSGYYVR